MKTYAYKDDWFFHPIVIQAGVNDTIRVNMEQSGGIKSAVIAPGTYHWLLGWSVPEVSSFEAALWQALDDIAWTIPNGEEGFLMDVPLASPRLKSKGVNLAPLTHPGNGDIWQILTTDPLMTLNPTILGLSRDEDADFDYDTIQDVTRWISPFGVGGIFKPMTVNKAIFASDKRSNKDADTTWSTTRARGRVANTWYEQRVRTFLYQNVRAGHIYPARNLDPFYAAVAGLGLGDQSNGWLDVHEALKHELPVYVVHDTPTLPPQGTVNYPPGVSEQGPEWLEGKLERVQFANLRSAGNVAATITTVQLNGEAYNIDTSLVASQVGDFAIYPQ